MEYNVYKGDELVAEKVTEKTYTVEGLVQDTEHTFSVTAVEGGKESEKATVTVRTKKTVINVTGVTVAPKTSEAVTGKADGANITATVAPENATNKAVTYKVAPETEGLAVNENGRITWTATVPAGTYTTTVTTVDGNKTDTHVMTLKDPVTEPEG